MKALVRDLLHTKTPTRINTSDESKTLADGLGVFFKEKILKLKKTVKTRINLNDHKALDFDQPFNGQPMDTLPIVSQAEVFKLLAGLPPKSSPMDFIPTSLLKSCSDVFSIIIAKIANLSFEE